MKNKDDWYKDVFGFEIKNTKKKSIVVPIEGDVPLPVDPAGADVHYTVFRDTWKNSFENTASADEILELIFGSGHDGLHVTFSGGGRTEHCYRGLPAGENPLLLRLAELLGEFEEKLREAIETARQTPENFEWDEKEFYQPVVSRGLERIAEIASREHSTRVVFPGQNDAAFVWSGASVHPLQSLQNTHQRAVRDASRGLDSDRSRDVESEQLGRYFYFQAMSPTPIGVPKEEQQSVDAKLEEAEATLKKAEKVIQKGSQADPASKPAKKALKKCMNILYDIYLSFAGDDDRDCVPSLRELNEHEQAAREHLEVDRLEEAHKAIVRATRAAGEAVQGVAAVQNFHIIEPFYLFRLMMKFQIRSETTIETALPRKVSSLVTDLLHNHFDGESWLFTWLAEKLTKLNGELLQLDGRTSSDAGPPKKVCFYLKGGRAAKYAQNKAEEGENDWDTNIIINPLLPAHEWHETFNATHNIVLRFLQRCKRELLLKIYKKDNAEALFAAIDRGNDLLQEDAEGAEGAEGAEDTTDPLQNDADTIAADSAANLADAAELDLTQGERQNCKAELIDIGIPRRDTIEAFEQWSNVCPNVLTKNGMPIPGHLYYVAEYVLMIREAFMGISISLHKTPKRIVRLYDILNMDGDTGDELDKAVKRVEEDHIGQDALPDSLAAVKNDTKGDYERRLLTVLLGHFAEAYDLHVDPDFASCVDKQFSGGFAERAKAGKPPEPLQKEVDSYVPKHTDEQTTVMHAIGYAQSFSEKIDNHLRTKRAGFIMDHERELVAFIKAVYTASFFSPLAMTELSPLGKDDQKAPTKEAQQPTPSAEPQKKKSRGKPKSSAAPRADESRNGKESADAPKKGDPASMARLEHEDYNVQFAISGAYAGLLHARYANSDRMKELEPVRRIDLTIYAPSYADPATAIELLEPLIVAACRHHSLPNLTYAEMEREKGTPGPTELFLQWPEQQNFGDFSYKPLVCRVAVATYEDSPPPLAFIRGLPVLNLRDTIWEAKKRAGEVEEAFTQMGLRKSIDALVDILTKFENPGPPMPRESAATAGESSGGQPPEDPSTPGDAKVVWDTKSDAGFKDGIVQKRTNWCWAATSLMMQTRYLGDSRPFKTQEDLVKDALYGSEKHDEPLPNTQNALFLKGLEYEQGPPGGPLPFDTIWQQIDSVGAFIVADKQHYYVCYGCRKTKEGRQELQLWDPFKKTNSTVYWTWDRYAEICRSGGATYYDFKAKPAGKTSKTG